MPALDLSRLTEFGRPVHYYASIDTTMGRAVELAEAGEPAGAIVVAEEQTAGRGRFGRSWISEREAGLYFSIILRPRVTATDAAVATLALGLASARAIRRIAALDCDLRWPNDVLIAGRKCCGILTEMGADGERVRYIVAGIGANVNQARLPDELGETATSLQIETGCEYSREALLGEILKEIDRYMAILAKRGPAAVVELFQRASSYAEGKRVVAVSGAEKIEGSTAGLTPGGTLLVRRDDGATVPVLAGSVRPLAE